MVLLLPRSTLAPGEMGKFTLGHGRGAVPVPVTCARQNKRCFTFALFMQAVDTEIASKSFDLWTPTGRWERGVGGGGGRATRLNRISRSSYSKIVTFPGASFLNFTLDSFKWAPRWHSKSY